MPNVTPTRPRTEAPPTWLNPEVLDVPDILMARSKCMNDELDTMVRRLVELLDHRAVLVDEIWSTWPEDLPTEATDYGSDVMGLTKSDGLLTIAACAISDHLGSLPLTEQVPALFHAYGFHHDDYVGEGS